MSKPVRLEEIQGKFQTALQGDLEHGVAWMNDEASREFAKRYPFLRETLNWLMQQEDKDECERQLSNWIDGYWCINGHTGCKWNDGDNECSHEGESSSPLGGDDE
jgi:hypothetical protein